MCSTGSLFFRRVVDLDPKHIKLVRENSIRDLLGRPHTAAERASRQRCRSAAAVFTIEIGGKRMLLDTEGVEQESAVVQVCEPRMMRWITLSWIAICDRVADRSISPRSK